jgi:REP element-mobilizing transposase RayT
MPRPKRIRDPGLIRHAISRGNGKMPIFLDEEDYRKFFFVLSDVLDDYDVECWDFCAMPNHYHLTLVNRQPNLSEAIQHFNGEYGGWWNEVHRHCGHVYQGRFKDQIVQDDDYVRSLTRYIAMNPVRAGLVRRPEDWPWSSYRFIAGLETAPSFLMTQRVLDRFGPGPVADQRRRYIDHVRSISELEQKRVEAFRSRQRVVGDRSFKQSVLKGQPQSASAHAEADPVPVNSISEQTESV